MARFSRLHVYNALERTRVIPLFFNKDPETAKALIAACAEGGAETIEFTNRGGNALEIFTILEQFAAKEFPAIILGVGSIPDAEAAALYAQAGANFIVAPFTDDGTSRFCNGRRLPYIPGCGSVTEIHNADILGCEYAKVFPGTQVGGPGFIKAVKGPCPQSKLIPTGGVSPTEESLKAWFDSGVACVGLGSQLIPGTIGETKDFKSVSEKLKFSIAYIKDHYQG